MKSLISEYLIKVLESFDRKYFLKKIILHQKVYKLYGDERYKIKEVRYEK